MSLYIIKVGGGKEIRFDYIAEDTKKILIRNPHDRFVFFTGGAELLDEECAKRKISNGRVKTPRGKTTRYTTKQLLQIFEEVYSERNQAFVNLLISKNLDAVGLLRYTNHILIGKREPKLIYVDEKTNQPIIVNDNYAGKPEKINSDVLKNFIDKQQIPVICPPAITSENEKINVDGDLSASLIAQELKADYFIILSNVPGLLEDLADAESIIRKINISDYKDEKEFYELAKGRFKEKLRAVYRATNSGIDCRIADGKIEKPISSALEEKCTRIIR